jgi:hypothetical protein
MLLATSVASAGLSAQPSRAATGTTLFLPAVAHRTGAVSPYGVHSFALGNDTFVNLTTELGARVVRHGFLRWRLVQPSEGAPYNWAAVADLDLMLRKMRQAGIAPMLIIGDSPSWATIPRYSDGRSTACAAIPDDRHAAFAAFVRAAVERYKQPEFGVSIWEIGNEVDVDPTLVVLDSGFGCWGDIRDPYYGGERYGRMLKLVYPAIKASDPDAQVLFGGLLLHRPATTDPNRGKPERFFEGALRAGAGNFFDILPYHAYPVYLGQQRLGRELDYDITPNTNWYALGGNVRGKAAFLREVMARYKLDKRLWLNEISLICYNDKAQEAAYPWCFPPDVYFASAQANHLVRSFVRAMDAGVEHLTWYSLEDTWSYSWLVDPTTLQPTPTYSAYQQLSTRLGNTNYLGRINYGAGIEAYNFSTGSERVQVVFTSDGDTSRTISVPAGQLAAAYTRDGAPYPVTPTMGGDQLVVSFTPIYLVMR